MKTIKPLRVALCVTTYTFGSVLSLPAQQPEGPTPPPKPSPGRPVPQLVNTLDTDKDGVISAKEITHAAAALRTLDHNADGQLTPEELGPPPPPAPVPPREPRWSPAPAEAPGAASSDTRPAPLPPRGEGQARQTPPHIGPGHRSDRPVRSIQWRGPSPLLAALDTDRDHTLSSAEIEAASSALRSLDRNGDGLLTREELAPPPPPREAFERRRHGHGVGTHPGPQGAPVAPPPAGPQPEAPRVDEPISE